MDFLSIDPLLRKALLEDLGRGDVTTDAILESPAAAGDRKVQAAVLARESLVLAGWPVFLRVFELLGQIRAEAHFQEGEEVPAGRKIGTICAAPGILLKGERVALNFLQRLSGIAGRTRRCVDLIAGTPVTLLDTRKTTPLWRTLEKYAVRTGGARNHRLGLDDGILLKENHIAVAGGIRPAIRACAARRRHLQRIEVEVRNLQELQEALEEGADAILLDNMNPDQVRNAVQITGRRCTLEVSGGVTEDNLVAFAETGVDFISLGSLTHSVRCPDISLLIEPLSL